MKHTLSINHNGKLFKPTLLDMISKNLRDKINKQKLQPTKIIMDESIFYDIIDWHEDELLK